LKAFLLWFWEAIPRTPRRDGILIRIYYWWTEAFTPAGKTLSALALFSLFVVVLPGFSLAGFFLWGAAALALVSLFFRRRKVKAVPRFFSAHSVTEGETLTLKAGIRSEKKSPMVAGLGIFRTPGSLIFENEIRWRVLPPFSSETLTAALKTLRRGSFVIHGARFLELQSLGFYRSRGKPLPPLELLVFPKVSQVFSFPFLVRGASGREFAHLLNPSLQRGMEFIGIREYREGDSPRDLHARAFARYLKPFTKEFAVERGSGVILLLDVSCEHFRERAFVEDVIRLCAGIGLWLESRGVFGRFFIGSEEVSFRHVSGSFHTELLSALARIPQAGLGKWETPKPWAPEARPMGPVLSISLHELASPFITKQVIVSDTGKSSDEKLLVPPALLKEVFAGKRKGLDL
jgi:uncharacterized protein (DUF58 family)